MDVITGSEIRAWLVAAVALVTLLMMLRNRKQDVNESEMQNALKPIREDMQRFSMHHDRHFKDINALTERLAMSEQRVESHEIACKESRERIEGMFREIRQGLNDIRSAKR